MFNSVVKITPKRSSSIDYIKWDSELEALTICYHSSDICYSYADVDEHEFLAMQGLAQQRLSWGRAVHKWKENRAAAFRSRARREFEIMWDNLHPSDRRRYVRWANQKDLTAQIT